jgi:catechol 2,3-dioxygenase-like lactoylglutathione lyase family enzyme
VPRAEAPARSTTEGRPARGFAPLVPELDVTSLDESLRFWCGLLGFSIAYERRDDGFAYLDREGVQVMLCQINGNWETAPLERPLGRGVNFQIEVSAVAPILAALSAARWPLFRALHDRWYRIGADEGGNRQFLVQDPDGYLLRFFENLGMRPAAPA